MRPELDFKALRAQIEAATRLPSFEGVRRRARRVRLRDRLAVGGAMLGTLAVFAPVTLAAMHGRPTAPAVIGPDQSGPEQTIPPVPPDDPDRPVSVALRAAGGSYPDHAVVVLDVCAGPSTARRCSLQVARLGNRADSRQLPVLIHALRQSPTEILTSVELVPMSEQTMLLNVIPADRPPANLRFSVNVNVPATEAADTPRPPNARYELRPGDRLIQLAANGDLLAVRQTDNLISGLPSQPAITQLTPVTSIPARSGWWATGSDPITGRPCVAVSHDQGATWTVRALPGTNGLDTATVVSYDGQTAYAFLRGARGLRQLRSTDGGAQWTEVTMVLPLPAPAPSGPGPDRTFGAVVRPDTSVLLWFDDPLAPVFMESADGVTFRSTKGPGGPVVAIDGGFVALGSQPALSRDGVNWAAVPLPAYLPPPN